MATYIQGVTDYIPQIQPFVPDYNFYSGALDFKQGKHDAARQQLSNVYGSLLNAPLTRDDNAETRDKFFKAIDQDIHKMSGMDMSLRSNVDAAQGIFDQLLDNDYVSRDMAWTKNYQNETKRSEYLKNCIDPEKCGGGWWQGGDQALNYARQEFQQAPLEQTLNMNSPKYVAYQDVNKRALDLAKEADLNVTRDIVSGQWITTVKNGPELIGKQLQHLFGGIIGKDPKVREYYKTKAMVDRKNFMYQNQGQYGSLEAAEEAYMDQGVSDLEAYYGRSQEIVEDDIANTKGKKEKLDKAIENSLPHEAESLEELRAHYQGIEDGYNSSLDVIKEGTGIINVAQNNQKYMGDQFDSLMAGLGLDVDLQNASTAMSYRNHEITQAENPYSMEAVKQQNRMLLERLKHSYAVNLKKMGIDATKAAKQAELTGYGEHNVPTTVTNVPGNTTKESNVEGDYALLHRSSNKFGEAYKNLQNQQSGGEKMLMDQVIRRATAAAESVEGDDQATDDYINMFQQYVAAAASNQENVVMLSRGDMPERGVFDDVEVSKEATLGALGLGLSALTGFVTALPITATIGHGIEKLIDGNLFSDLSPEDQKIADAKKAAEKVKANPADPFDASAVSAANAAKLAKLRDVNSKIENASTRSEKYAIAKASGIDLNAISGGQVDYLYDNTVAKMLKDTSAGNAVLRDYLEVVRQGSLQTRLDIETKGIALKELSNWYAKASRNAIADARADGDYDEKWLDGFESYLDKDGHVVDKATFVNNMVLKGYKADDAAELFRKDSEQEYTHWDSPLEGWYEDEEEAGHRSEGIHDKFKKMWTAKAELDGAKMWPAIKGSGDFAAPGAEYQVDAGYTKSVGTMGVHGFMKDVIRDTDAVFASGFFENEIPENNKGMQDFMNVFYRDLQATTKVGKMRFTATYADVAGSDKNKVGLNIKFDPAYLNKYKGSSDDNPLIDKSKISELTSEGITMYMDQNKTNNLFTQGAKSSSMETLMDYTGEINLDHEPKYSKDFKIKADNGAGVYRLSGRYMDGLDPKTGKPTWYGWQGTEAYGEDLNDVINKYQTIISAQASDMHGIELAWLEANKTK